MKTQTERGIRFDISCEVCRDLMPLVRDGVASADSEAVFISLCISSSLIIRGDARLDVDTIPVSFCCSSSTNSDLLRALNKTSQASFNEVLVVIKVGSSMSISRS